ncbi:hypothetical protein LLEC1_07282, partial [Akanthomyces lecanii]
MIRCGCHLRLVSRHTRRQSGRALPWFCARLVLPCSGSASVASFVCTVECRAGAKRTWRLPLPPRSASCARHHGQVVIDCALDLVQRAPPARDRQAHALDLDLALGRLAHDDGAVDDEHALAAKLGRVARALHR